MSHKPIFIIGFLLKYILIGLVNNLMISDLITLNITRNQQALLLAQYNIK